MPKYGQVKYLECKYSDGINRVRTRLNPHRLRKSRLKLSRLDISRYN